MTNVHILYIDDDENDILLLQNAFKRTGILNPLHVATDGQMALDYLSGAGPFADRGQHPLPGLVLLDLKVPVRDGLEVLEWIRRQAAFKSIVVIVLTSSPHAEDTARAYELGANSFVIKPLNIQQLSDLARRLKEWWLESNQYGSLAAHPST